MRAILYAITFILCLTVTFILYLTSERGQSYFEENALTNS
jgi:hypothetical protein